MNLRKFAKFAKLLENLRNSQFFEPIFCENFEIAAVQKDANLVDLEKCCQRQSNAYFLAKFRFDTAENEPAKNLQNFANFPNFAKQANPRRRRWTSRRSLGAACRRGSASAAAKSRAGAATTASAAARKTGASTAPVPPGS